ncbi:MAG TPA: TonB-dependent receptor plug domain-containing protein, partial [Rhodocyclaceae bacterium]|nr:TonB-dependent receptor plug domain-containing protein [Rhodocyclaceae bacterium]
MQHRIIAILIAAMGAPATVAAEEAPVLGEVSVTATREARPVAETPATVSSVKEGEIAESRPRHPSELLNQLPGVRLSNLSGEGHSTSIRQPLTTGAVYLFLEDGIPTRSTGFFNHNAL